MWMAPTTLMYMLMVDGARGLLKEIARSTPLFVCRMEMVVYGAC